jgi:hypothetical protein
MLAAVLAERKGQADDRGRFLQHFLMLHSWA